MISREDLESFLIRTEMEYEEIGECLWIVDPPGGTATGEPAVVLSYSPPLVVFRAKIGTVPEGAEDRLKLYEQLLTLNATDLVHGAYGLDGNEIVLSDTLQLADLDFSEIQASLESILMALRSHFETLSRYRNP